MSQTAVVVLTPDQILSLVRECVRQEISALSHGPDSEAVEIEKLSRKAYLTDKQVETVFGLKANTLRKQRVNGLGPSYVKDGEKVLYSRQVVEKYLESKRQKTHDQP